MDSDERSWGMKARHEVEFAAVAGVSGLLRCMPRDVALAAGAGLGRLGWGLRVRRRAVLDHLGIAFEGSSEEERLQIARSAAMNFGRTVAEFLRFPGGDRERVLELVHMEGLEPLQELRAKGQSAVLVTAHLGAWALYTTALGASGLPATLLVGKQTNPRVDRFLHSLPGGAAELVSKAKSSPRQILRAIKGGRLIVLVADHYSSDQRVRAPFLGKPAYTLPLPAALVEKHDLPLYSMAGHREDGGRHRVVVEPVPLGSDSAGGEVQDREAVRLEISRRVNEALGNAILRHPDQYFWYHRRWKERRKRDAT